MLDLDHANSARRSGKYSASIYGLFLLAAGVVVIGSFASTAGAEPKIIERPTVSQIKKGLTAWSKRWPDRITVEVRGKTAEGRPILLARITDTRVPDADKQVVLLTSTHAGMELTGCTGLLHLARWLITDDPAAVHIRKGVVTLVMPSLNPDGLDKRPTPELCTTQGVNVYYAWDWDGPIRPGIPECEAVYRVAEEYRPDAALDVHGVMLQEMAMWESTGFSWASFSAGAHCPAFVEEINLAAERAGFLMIRPQEDCGRMKVTAPVKGLGHHFYYPGNSKTIMTFLYNRYHTLAINCEAGYDGSVVARARRLLELATEKWRHEFYPGYPVNQIGNWSSMAVTAWGDTARRRRLSRVELWRKTNQIFYALIYYMPFDEKLMAVCVTTGEGAKRWFGGDPSMKRIRPILKKLAENPRIDEQYLLDFVAGSTMTHIPARHGTQGYDPPKDSDKLQHGLAVRLFIPYPDAEPVDVRIDGHPVPRSATDGYLLRHKPGTVVQLNIPPEKVDELHFFTCRYRHAGKRRKNGFRPEDWDID